MRSINIIKQKGIFTWDIQRNIGVGEKWALKKEEPVKEIKENKLK